MYTALPAELDPHSFGSIVLGLGEARRRVKQIMCARACLDSSYAIVFGSSPLQCRPSSSVLMRLISSSLSTQPNGPRRFSTRREGLVVFGIAAIPRCNNHRRTTEAGVTPCVSANATSCDHAQSHRRRKIECISKGLLCACCHTH